jgi:hypothetical protein
MAIIQIQAVTENEPDIGKSTDLKMEAIPRISCLQYSR